MRVAGLRDPADWPIETPSGLMRSESEIAAAAVTIPCLAHRSSTFHLILAGIVMNVKAFASAAKLASGRFMEKTVNDS